MADILGKRTVYDGWATVCIVRIRLSDSTVIDRFVEDHGRAVAVLAYDPQRRVAMLVEQLRAPVLVTSGIPQLREVPAGMLDEDDPAACARREALEECGLRLQQVEHVAQCWTMPGASTEQMDMFLATYGEHDRVAVGGGLPDEHENITALEVPLRELAAAADRGNISDLKTYALVQTLRLRRPELFA